MRKLRHKCQHKYVEIKHHHYKYKCLLCKRRRKKVDSFFIWSILENRYKYSTGNSRTMTEVLHHHGIRVVGKTIREARLEIGEIHPPYQRLSLI